MAVVRIVLAESNADLCDGAGSLASFRRLQIYGIVECRGKCARYAYGPLFTSDNGGPVNIGSSNWPLRGSKLTLWEGGTKVVSLLHSKTLLRSSTTFDGLVHAVDWYPTLIGIAGGRTAIQDIDGLDLWDSISRDGGRPREEFVYDINDTPQRAALRFQNYKLTWNYPGKPDGWYNAPRDHHNRLSVDRPQKKYLLFDLAKDPREENDVSDRSGNKALLSKMIAKLKKYRRHLVPSLPREIIKQGDPARWNGTWMVGWC